MDIKISEIEQVFKDIFEEEEGVVNSVDTVYEMSSDEKFYKLVISIHGLSTQDTSIIHTKFIFKTDLDKRNLVENSLPSYNFFKVLINFMSLLIVIFYLNQSLKKFFLVIRILVFFITIEFKI